MKMLFKSTFAAIATYLGLLLLPASCSFETEVGGGNHYTGRKVALNIQMEARTATDPDQQIDRVRAIVFTGEGRLVHNEVSTPATAADGTCTVKVRAARGINHVYLICNETTELTGKLAAVTARSDIEDITFNAVGITAAPPMYGKVENANVKSRSDGSQATVTVGGVTSEELSVKVNRMVARIGFTAIKNVDTSTSEDFKVTKLCVRVCHMPTQTTIGEGRAYTVGQWSDDLLIEKEGLLDNNGAYDIDHSTAPYTYTVPAGIHSIVLPDTYIPEHLLSVPTDPADATYLKIEAQCQMKNGSTQVLHGVYLLNIGQGSSLNYNLERNNYFHIYATITGMGALGIYAEIVAMEEHDITINWKPIDGLVIVSDKLADFDAATGISKNVNVWDDYNAYSGILKTYHAETGYKDVVFKYGSLIAVSNNASSGTLFAPPAGTDLKDILWYPASFNALVITDWAGVPYRTSGDIPPANSVDEVKKALGDPCKLVGLSEVQIRDNGIVDNQQWHMATAEQYQILINANDNETNANGYPSFHWLLQPHALYRGTNGEVAGDLNSGYYWTPTFGKAFNFSGATPTAVIEDMDTQNGYAIRCVRNTIPESSLQVVRSISVSYKGGTASFDVESNVPYWTASLIKSGPDVGNSTDFGDYSFKQGEEVHTTYGSYSQSIPAYIQRKESQSIRNFKIKIEGTGLDGKTVSAIATNSQNGYEFKGTMAFSSTVKPVPQAGGNYTVTVNLTPTDISIPAGTLQLSVFYMNAAQTYSSEVATESHKYSYPIELQIKPNTNPDMIGISVFLILKRTGMVNLEIGRMDLQQKGTN